MITANLMADVQRALARTKVDNSSRWAVFMAFGEGYEAKSGRPKPWPLHSLSDGHDDLAAHAGNTDNGPFFIANNMAEAFEFCEWARKVLYTDEGRKVLEKQKGSFICRVTYAVNELSKKYWD